MVFPSHWTTSHWSALAPTMLADPPLAPQDSKAPEHLPDRGKTLAPFKHHKAPTDYGPGRD